MIGFYCGVRIGECWLLMTSYFCLYASPFGEIGIAEESNAIARVFFCMPAFPTPLGHVHKKTPLLKEAERQFDAYFAGDLRRFDLPLLFRGTDFQKKIWQALQDIPYGETRSYGDVAKMVDHPKASRAVGMANNRNPIAIIAPCHRVIGKNGSLVGYAPGLHLKRALLEHESGTA